MKMNPDIKINNKVIEILTSNDAEYMIIGSLPFGLSTSKSDVDVTVYAVDCKNIIEEVKRNFEVVEEFFKHERNVIEFLADNTLYSLWIGDQPLLERDVVKEHLEIEEIWNKLSSAQIEKVIENRLKGMKTYAAIRNVIKEE